MRKSGLILQPPHVLSTLKGANLPVRRPGGSWSDVLPDFEAQRKLGLETMNCVQFSFLNVLETIARSYGKTLDLSDRFLSWAAGCTKQGNTYSRCIDGFLKHGCCDESLWRWIQAMSWETYNAEPPDFVKREAAKIFEEWDFGGIVWVPSTVGSFREALKLSPLWFCNSLHSMEMHGVDGELKVFDTYGTGMGSFPLDYAPKVEAAYNVIFVPKSVLPPSPMFDFKENAMYQLVEGVGGFLLYAKGRLYLDEAAKIQASWTVRNGKPQADGSTMFLGGRVGTLRLKDIENVPLFNLKDEPTTI